MTKQKFSNHILALQDIICNTLSEADGKAVFAKDQWQRPGGGGGLTRVIADGNIFEKGGVNTSEVYGEVTPSMKAQLKLDGEQFYATGISLVLHPANPFVPTVHANFRYFELYDKEGAVTDAWFGGGMDLTPYYLFEEDAIHFHQTIKESCDRFNSNWYPVFKKTCDEYFVNAHRNNEARGIGGIFFDHMRENDAFDFVLDCSTAFLKAYLPVVKKRQDTAFTPANRYWQEIRRGRYVEFNLIHDRGTLFGLKTNGRTESILMSLPPTVRFDYNYTPAIGSDEEKLQQVCITPRNWV